MYLENNINISNLETIKELVEKLKLPKKVIHSEKIDEILLRFEILIDASNGVFNYQPDIKKYLPFMPLKKERILWIFKDVELFEIKNFIEKMDIDNKLLSFPIRLINFIMKDTYKHIEETIFIDEGKLIVTTTRMVFISERVSKGDFHFNIIKTKFGDSDIQFSSLNNYSKLLKFNKIDSHFIKYYIERVKGEIEN